VKLPISLRDELKIPLGHLIPDYQVDKTRLKKFISANSYVITVGDKTTTRMIELGFIPSLQIIDNQEKRIKLQPTKSNAITELRCDNPAAEITSQSIKMIKKAFTSITPVRLVISGEEDLLVIPVCIHAPENAVVLYGQPNEGLVVVKITPEIRNKTQGFLDSME
jgi:hypothetical protein